MRSPARARADVLAFLFALLCAAPCSAFLAPEHFLQRTFRLHSGRATACPATVSYGTASGLTVPASAMAAGGARCSGPGGKVLRSGEALRVSGLQLPTLVRGAHTRFFVGVESATRVCGPWAFNASAISWFVASSRAFKDADTGVGVEPGFLYAAYSHFAHLCVYRTKLREAESASIGHRALAAHAVHNDRDHGPAARRHCFPAAARVATRNGPRRMDQLAVGDEVLAGPAAGYSRIYAFSHADAAALAPFVEVTAGPATLRLTAGHLMYAGGRLVPAGHVRVGDEVTLEDGARARVTGVRTVLDRGLFAPHTVSGDIIVDGVAASSFTEAVRPAAAHALLAPFRVSAPLRWQCEYVFAAVAGAMHRLRSGPASVVSA